MTTYLMPLTFTTPPLNANQRHHWATRARITKQLRHEAHTRARAMRLPTTTYATVTLHWQPATNRRRDRHNQYPTVKALVDGLVDYGLVPDDTAEHLSAPEPVIHPHVRGEAKCWLEITTRGAK